MYPRTLNFTGWNVDGVTIPSGGNIALNGDKTATAQIVKIDGTTSTGEQVEVQRTCFGYRYEMVDTENAKKGTFSDPQLTSFVDSSGQTHSVSKDWPSDLEKTTSTKDVRDGEPAWSVAE